MKKTMMPIGVDNFATLVRYRVPEDNPYLFVDKSLFIKEFIGAGDVITLITRPRRFGKSLTLSMLQHFLASEVSGQRTKGLFDGLKISQHPEIMRHQGQYPVIFLTLKEAKGKDFEEMYGVIKNSIRDLYETHHYLLLSDVVFSNQKNLFEKFLNEEATKENYKASLHFLSQLLYQHTGKKVYILLDEYDTPIHDAYVHDYYEACRSFLAAMLGKTFKGNNFLERALITGILKVAKSSLFSELNNVKVYTMLSKKYAPYFGFTEEETDDLLNRAGLPQKAHALKEMYNGYEIGQHTLYNPFSIVSFIDEVLNDPEAPIEEALKPYWVNSGGTHLIGDMIQNNLADLEEGLTALLQGKSLKTPINEEVIFHPNLRHNGVAFWSVLLLSGYLKVVDKEIDEFGTYQYHLLFPNEEIKRAIRLMLIDIVAGGLYHHDSYLLGIRALVKEDIDGFTAFLKEYMRRSPSYFDTGGERKELFYHGLVLGMTTALLSTHHITSNRESGAGRYDIALQPKDKKRKGIVIEIKIADEKEDLKQVAQRACEQIATKQYAQEMQAQGIKDFLYVGIAFRDKQVEVVTK